MNHSQSFLMGGMSQADTKTAALVAEVERLTRELAEVRRDAKILRDGYQLLISSSDSEMRDGDLARDIAAAMLRTDAGAKTG